MFRASALLAAVALCCPMIQLAWSDSPTVREQLQGLDAPNGSSTATTYQSKVSVETSTDKSTASINLSDVVSSSQADYYALAFSAKAPFDSSKSDVTDLGDLSGLTAGTQVHVAVSWTRWKLLSSQGMKDIDDFQRSSYFAQLYGGYQWVTPTVTDGPTLRDALVAAKLDPTPQSLIVDEDTYQKVVSELNKQIDAYNTKNALKPGFQKLDHVSAVSDYRQIATHATQSYRGTLAQYAPTLIPKVALSLDGNQQSFSFSSAQNPTKVTKEGKNGGGASIVGYELGTNWLASLTFSYARSYKAQPQGQICTPISGSTSTNCVSSALGEPKKMTQRLITAEYRQRIFSTLAVSPQVQYSEADSKWAIRLPIYMMADKSKLLNGGVTLGWTTADHFGAAIFVGKPFSFL